MASYATSLGGPFAGYGGSNAAAMYSGALNNITQLVNQYAGNHALAGAGVGAILDSQTTRANAATQAEYDKSFAATRLAFEKALSTQQSELALKYAAAESGLEKERMAAAGDQNRATLEQQQSGQLKQTALEGEQARFGYKVQGEEQRKAQDNERKNVIALRQDARQQASGFMKGMMNA